MQSARPPLVVHDARTSNLTGVTVRIPSPALTVVTGLSGSGESPLVFDTIARESQRQLDEVFPLFVRNRLPKFERPDFERRANLAPAIVVDQRNIDGRTAPPTASPTASPTATRRCPAAPRPAPGSPPRPAPDGRDGVSGRS